MLTGLGGKIKEDDGKNRPLSVTYLGKKTRFTSTATMGQAPVLDPSVTPHPVWYKGFIRSTLKCRFTQTLSGFHHEIEQARLHW